MALLSSFRTGVGSDNEGVTATASEGSAVPTCSGHATAIRAAVAGWRFAIATDHALWVWRRSERAAIAPSDTPEINLRSMCANRTLGGRIFMSLELSVGNTKRPGGDRIVSARFPLVLWERDAWFAIENDQDSAALAARQRMAFLQGARTRSISAVIAVASTRATRLRAARGCSRASVLIYVRYLASLRYSVVGSMPSDSAARSRLPPMALSTAWM